MQPDKAQHRGILSCETSAGHQPGIEGVDGEVFVVGRDVPGERVREEDIA